jgi:hypothetical protein
MFTKLLKKVDAYGAPIELTYKNKTKYQTTFGGSLTLISRLAVIVYLCILIKDVILRNQTKLY